MKMVMWKISVERTTRNRHFLRGSNGAIGSTTTRTRTSDLLKHSVRRRLGAGGSLLLFQIRDTVPLKKDKKISTRLFQRKNHHDIWTARLPVISLYNWLPSFFLSKSLSSFSSLQDGRISTVDNAYKNVNLSYITSSSKVSAAYMSFGLMLLF